MTLLNAWWEPDANGNRTVRWGFVQCDKCVTPRWPIGDAVALRARGWRFKDFETGPHSCPLCARGAGQQHDERHLDDHRALPNLLIIGAVKCGTTSLHRYLGMHPEVGMSERKELNFFQNPHCLDDLGAYAPNFDPEATVRGESSPIYAFHPISSGTPERIRAAIPDVKLIYVVRDPVERFVSHFLQRRNTGKEPLSLDQALEQLDMPCNQYFVAGSYATQLEQYLKVFPADQMLVIDQADLHRSRSQTLKRIFGFLGVDETFTSPAWDERHNSARGQRRRGATWISLRRGRLARAARQLPPRPREALFRSARRLLSSDVEPLTVDERARRRLAEAFEDEVLRLRELTGQEFSTWTGAEATNLVERVG